MATLSLREAAEQTQTSKSTIFRAIKAGRLSAGRDDDGNFAIDPAELFRVYPPGSAVDHEDRNRTGTEDQDAPAHETTWSSLDHDLAVRLAAAEAEVRGLKEMVEELRRSRDKWEAQAERLALAPPTPVTVKVEAETRRSWWPWRRSA